VLVSLSAREVSSNTSQLSKLRARVGSAGVVAAVPEARDIDWRICARLCHED